MLVNNEIQSYKSTIRTSAESSGGAHTYSARHCTYACGGLMPRDIKIYVWQIIHIEITLNRSM